VRAVVAERHRWTGLVLAVVVSVAFVTATLSLGSLTRSTLEGALDGRFGAVDVVVWRGGGQVFAPGSAFRGPVPADALGTIRGVAGVEEAAGVIEGAATVIGRDGRPLAELFGSGTTATNWIGGPLGGVELIDGAAPTGGGEAVLDTGTAAAAGVSVGDEVTIDLPTASRRVRVVGVAGIVRDGKVVPGPRLVWMDAASVRVALDKPPGFDLVVVRTEGETVARRIDAVLDDEIEVHRGAELIADRQTQVRLLAEVFERPLAASAGIAVFVGAFVIFNTFSIVVSQRVKEMALLRAVGATTRQVTTSVLAEAIVVGSFGSAIGVGLGWLVAVGTRGAFSSLLELPDGPLEVSWGTSVVALTTGVVATLAACAIPARRAGATAPVSVLRSAEVDDSHRWTTRHTVGLVLLAVAVALVVVVLTGTVELGVAAVGAGCAAVFVAFAMIGSAVVGPIVSALGRPLERARGLTGRLAIRSAARSPGRTTLVIVALSIGVSMVTVITTFEASIRSSTEDRATGQLGGVDLLVESPVGVPRTVAPALRAVDGVAEVMPLRLGVMTVMNSADALRYRADALANGARESPDLPPLGASKFLTGIDLAAARTMMDLPGLRPAIADLADGEVMVLEKTADLAGWEVGDTVRVWFATTGRVDLRLAATFDATFGVGAEYVANLDTTAANAPPEFAGDSMVWGKVDDGVAVADVVRRAGATVRPLAPAARIVSVDRYLDDRMAGTTSLLNLLVVLVAVSVVVAWVGVANTVAMALRERRTEITRLRAMGLTRRQFHESAMWETLLIAVCGVALGVTTGWAMGAGFILSFDQVGLDPVVEPWAVVVIAVAGGAAAVATAWVQARRVSGPVLPGGR